MAETLAASRAPRICDGLGGPPRIAPIPEAELDERHRDAVTYIRSLTGFPQDAPIHSFFRTMCHSPDVLIAFTRLGLDAITGSALPARTRELAVLRTGWLCDAPYQWGEHVSTGLKAGLTREEVDRIPAGSAAPGWSAADRALLAAVEELHHTKAISDEAWAALASHFTDRQLVELPIVVGHYHMTALLQNALRFAPNRDRDGELIGGEYPE